MEGADVQLINHEVVKRGRSKPGVMPRKRRGADHAVPIRLEQLAGRVDALDAVVEEDRVRRTFEHHLLTPRDQFAHRRLIVVRQDVARSRGQEQRRCLNRGQQRRDVEVEIEPTDDRSISELLRAVSGNGVTVRAFTFEEPRPMEVFTDITRSNGDDE